MIVKIQRPLVSNDPAPKALVYNRPRTFEAQMAITPDIEALFADGSREVYHKANLSGSELQIGRRVRGLNW
jgi:hypothetical protein